MPFRTFRSKLALLMVLLMVISGVISNFMVYRYTLRAQIDQLKDKLMIIAQTMALTIDADGVFQIPLNKEGIAAPQYIDLKNRLSKIKDVVPDIIYIYILEKTNRKGVFKFVIDLKEGRRAGIKPAASPGDLYDGTRFPELMKAFNGPTADRQLVIDEWGDFMSGYAPIRMAAGEAQAVLGVDIAADDVHEMQKEVHRRALYVHAIGVVLSLVLGLWISGLVTKRLRRLTDGTRHIARGDLKYRVDIRGKDELGELARAFNHMAANLTESRKKLLEYFYGIMQSLVRILEARDPYTKGHSDRVSEYSELIARKMGLPQEKIDVLKEAALLHDIGKLGVQEVILNKIVKLTDDERKIIMKHPLIGENILRPIALHKEVLDVVREHHERYDGKGYPDRLSGESINILSAIVSVADSYDAMTSHRAYEKDFSVEEAMGQLRENSGTQFNPKVVEAFIQVMVDKKKV